MKYGFIKAATPSVSLRVADCAYNAKQIIAEIYAAKNHGVEVLVFPELCITGYTCKDLFWQDALLNAALKALKDIVLSTKNTEVLCFVGLPLMHQNKLYDCAVAIIAGQIIGIVPKNVVQNNAFTDESRIFSAAPLDNDIFIFDNNPIPFGANLLFNASENSSLCIGVSFSNDMSTLHREILMSDCGANLIVNLSANISFGGDFSICKGNVLATSKSLSIAYIFANAGEGESTTDAVYSGYQLIAENGVLLAETPPFMHKTSCADIDIEKICKIKLKAMSRKIYSNINFKNITFKLSDKSAILETAISKEPFMPLNYDEKSKNDFLEEAFMIQAHGLAKRMAHIGAKGAVIGVSGGLDSTLALLVMVKTFTLLKMPLNTLFAITMPCFGTSERTHTNAALLCKALGITLREIPISNTVNSHFNDIMHDSDSKDITYENAQARMRTMVLFDIANKENSLVVGTGDMSELALGWATFGGDHISMYNVNSSVPKTIIRQMVLHFAENADASLSSVLQDIVATPVSPELLPAANSDQMQKTENLVGPYELHDFFLYYMLAYGFAPEKIFFLAQKAFSGTFDNSTILHWLNIFYSRFFSSEFKRNCMTDGPQCFIISLSPRGGFEMPSDAMPVIWQNELNNIEKELV